MPCSKRHAKNLPKVPSFHFLEVEGFRPKAEVIGVLSLSKNLGPGHGHSQLACCHMARRREDSNPNVVNGNPQSWHFTVFGLRFHVSMLN